MLSRFNLKHPHFPPTQISIMRMYMTPYVTPYLTQYVKPYVTPYVTLYATQRAVTRQMSYVKRQSPASIQAVDALSAPTPRKGAATAAVALQPLPRKPGACSEGGSCGCMNCNSRLAVEQLLVAAGDDARASRRGGRGGACSGGVFLLWRASQRGVGRLQVPKQAVRQPATPGGRDHPRDRCRRERARGALVAVPCCRPAARCTLHRLAWHTPRALVHGDGGPLPHAHRQAGQAQG
mmetsp:Transcript_13099/g.38095  ORF Transcript_13099/g.38095 Transcript_13099/m.38095 type:complete len:236 (+) Transcript_13099:247-954(+)